MDFTAQEIANLQAVLLNGLGPSPRGHRPTPLERLAVRARYRALRESYFGPLPAGERPGVRNGLDEESPLAKKIFGGL